MRHPTRRAILSAGLLLKTTPFARPASSNPSIKPAAAHSIAFNARSGVNVVPLGFDIYQPMSIKGWDTALPPSRLTSLREAGFDHIRVAFDPSPALSATNAAAFDDIVATAKHALDTAMGCGLRIIFDLHVATQGGWSTAAIEADYPNGPKWRHYVEVAGRFAQLCSTYPATELAFELYNENSNNESFGNNGWANRVRALWTAVRALNGKTTLLVGGSFYTSIEGLRDLKASDFDRNTGFSVHNYNPTVFTHQNAASYTRYVQRLHYPPIPSERQAAIDGMTARVEASTMPDADKPRAIADRARRLATYFDQPQGGDYVRAKVREISEWQVRNGVPNASIFVTEFGSHNDHDFLGAPFLARLAWTQDVDRAHEAAGYCRSIWTYNTPDYWDITQENDSWRIKDGFLIALGHVPRGDLEPEAKALFGSAAGHPTPRDQALISETIRQLKENGLWEKLATLYVFAGPESTAVEWKRAASAPLKSPAMSHTQGRGWTNPPRTAIHLDLPTDARSRDGHVGLFVVGEKTERAIEVGWRGSVLIQLDPSGVTSGATTIEPSGDETMLHAIVSDLSFASGAVYVNGSYLGPGASMLHHEAGMLGASLSVSNRAGCAVVHTGNDALSAENAKDLFTILRFFVNGAARNASTPV